MESSIVLDKKERHWNSHLLEILILCSGLVWVIGMGLKNFLLFHTVVELFSIIIGITTFVIAINTYKTNKNQHLIFLGVAYGFISYFDLLHTLTYKGMNMFAIEGSDIPTQLWIIARYMESISILTTIVFLKKKIQFHKIMFSYFIFSTFLTLSVFTWNIFPKSFVEGVGLTNFKIISEYIICGIFAISIVLLNRNKASWDKKIYSYIVASIFITILSELFFTLYIGVYDLTNMAGHILKVASFYLIYKSIIQVGIKMPYEELYQSEEQYRNLVELFPESIFIIKEGKVILSNYKFSEVLGFKNSQQIAGKNLIDCVDEYLYPTIEKYTREVNENKDRKIFGEEILILDGREVVMEIMISPFPYEKYNATLVALRDITERKKAEKLARIAEENKKRLEKSLEYSKMKNEFYSNLSHEMRTPLNLLYSTVQILELELKGKLKDSECKNINKYILILRQNFYRMLRLVNNLLDITKMDAGYFKLELRNYNIVNVVEEITLSIAQYIEKKDVTLIFDTEVEEKIVAIDPNAMERIMLNLLSNAIKFTDAGEEIIVNIYDKEDSVLISVKDTGIGIPKDKLDGIFDRFNQIDKTLKRNQQGTGIGLSLVESLVKMHNGEICVHSEFGKGTEFIIKLPVQDVNYESYTIDDYSIGDNQDKYVEKINIEFSDIYSMNQIM